MEKEQINQLLDKQRQYFYSGATLDLDFRISALKRLRASIRKHEDQIHAALKKDLGKSNFESYMCETGLVLSEITHMLKNIRSYAKEQTVPTPLAQFPQTIPLRCGSHYESVELSVSSHHRTTGRRHCSRKHSHPETKCLLTGNKRSDPSSHP